MNEIVKYPRTPPPRGLAPAAGRRGSRPGPARRRCAAGTASSRRSSTARTPASRSTTPARCACRAAATRSPAARARSTWICSSAGRARTRRRSPSSCAAARRCTASGCTRSTRSSTTSCRTTSSSSTSATRPAPSGRPQRRRAHLARLAGALGAGGVARASSRDPHALPELVAHALYKSPRWRDRLRAAAAGAGVDADRATAETDPSDVAEGLYVKVEDDGVVVDRLQVDPRVVPDRGRRLRQPLARAADRAEPARRRRRPVRGRAVMLALAPGEAIDWTTRSTRRSRRSSPAADLAATPQDAAFHAEGDVWTHTRMAIEALVAGDGLRRAVADRPRASSRPPCCSTTSASPRPRATTAAS